MTLRELIDNLKLMKKDTKVSSLLPHCYRGDSDSIGLEPGDDCTVGDLIDILTETTYSVSSDVYVAYEGSLGYLVGRISLSNGRVELVQ